MPGKVEQGALGLARSSSLIADPHSLNMDGHERCSEGWNAEGGEYKTIQLVLSQI